MACKRCGYNGAGSPCPVCWPTSVTKPNENVTELVDSVVPTTTNVPTMSPPDAYCPHVMPAEELTPQCECGKPRDGRHAKCAACRKRAYRERSK